MLSAKTQAFILMLFFISPAFAYDDAFLRQMSDEVNATLPKPIDKYKTLDSTFYSQGITTYIYSTVFKKSDFSKEDMKYMNTGYNSVLSKKACAFHKAAFSQYKEKALVAYAGASWRYLTFDSQGDILHDFTFPVSDCYKP